MLYQAMTLAAGAASGAALWTLVDSAAVNAVPRETIDKVAADRVFHVEQPKRRLAPFCPTRGVVSRETEVKSRGLRVKSQKHIDMPAMFWLLTLDSKLLTLDYSSGLITNPLSSFG